MDKKQQLIDYLKTNHRTETWLELAKKFDIKPNKSDKQRAKAANDIWRRNKDKQDYIQQANDIPEGFEIKSTWQNAAGVWLHSLRPVKDLDSKEVRKQILEDFKSFSPTTPNTTYSPVDRKEIAYQINLPDFHFGRIPLDKAKDLFLSTVSKLVSRVKDNYKVDRFILPIGNDYFNSDLKAPTNKGGGFFATTAGTAQNDIADLEDTFRVGWQTLVEAITYLETIAPVYIIAVPGNHDAYRSLYLADLIYAWFRNSKNVFVDNDLRPFKVHTYGLNSRMYHHGDKIKVDKFPLIFAQEFPDHFALSKYKEIDLGHIHKHMVDEIYGIKINFLPSIAPDSKWEIQSGYKHNHCALGIKLHKTEGCIGYEQVNV